MSLEHPIHHFHIPIHHFHINTPCLPPQNLHNLCFPFPLDIAVVPREFEDNAHAKFWGANKVYYGGCGNGECKFLPAKAIKFLENLLDFKLRKLQKITVKLVTTGTDLEICIPPFTPPL